MSISQEIFNILNTDTTVKNIVSNRIYPNVARQKEKKPHIIWTIISTDRDQILSQPAGVATYLVQFDCVADTYDDAKTLCDAVRKAIDGYYGTPYEDKIEEITVTNEMDIPSSGEGVEVIERYGKLLEAEITIREIANNQI